MHFELVRKMRLEGWPDAITRRRLALCVSGFLGIHFFFGVVARPVERREAYLGCEFLRMRLAGGPPTQGCVESESSEPADSG
jgi:hypothetical protein